MKKTSSPKLHALALAAVAAYTLGLTSQAQAANHALIMTIDYAGTPNALPGIELDGKMAVEIAKGMGVPPQNIKWIRNQDLTLSGMNAAIQDLTRNRIANGDKVFMYYSGHGYQTNGSESKCVESLVAADVRFFEDERLKQTLDTLAAKASQVVMFNDSCFSGGAATKELARSDGDSVPKAYIDQSGASANIDYVCSQASNKDFGSRSLGVVARERPTQMLYVAASSDAEVSRASKKGSWATQAWASCLSGSAADRDGNGIVDGNELQQCAQDFIKQKFNKPQTITLVGNNALPMSFVGAGASTCTTPVTNPGGTLATIRAAADPDIKVGLSLAKSRLTIGRDLLDFSVSTPRDGYLYLLHVSSEGKFIVLFPNKIDSNNFVKAGNHRFPKQSWGIQAQGPAGTGYIMAYLADTPKEFTKDMDFDGPFSSGKANCDTTSKLGVVALNGRYGASAVAAIQEVK
ncbi:MAG: caspase family protein [Rhodoferax sp.]|nr:caspase family protein [Rhodoferax sp.]